MIITVGCLVYVREYGSDPHWWEVVAIKGDIVTCFNGHDEYFEVHISDIYNVTDDDSVLK